MPPKTVKKSKRLIMESLICLHLKSKILSRLPVELIVYEILSRLPIEKLLQLRCCNKGFRQLIDDPCFRQTFNDRVIHSFSAAAATDRVSFVTLIQLNERYDCRFYFSEYDDSSNEYKVTQRVPYPPILEVEGWGSLRCIIVGSCNGLVCRTADYQTLGFDPIYIFNPVTREKLTLPPFKFVRKKSRLQHLIYGFGYHPVTKEYKVVRICYTWHKGQRDDVDFTFKVHKVEVYTLGTGVWRSIGIPSLFNNSFEFPGTLPAVHVNGALYWIDDKGNTASFDLKTEDFHLIPSPSSFQLDGVHTFYGHCALTERLCVFRNRNISYLRPRVDIWVLNKDQSWTEEYDISIEINPRDHSMSSDCIYPITLTKSGKLLLWYLGKILVSYDPENGERKIHGDYEANHDNSIVVHVKSFVSLEALGEKTAKITRIRNQRLR